MKKTTISIEKNTREKLKLLGKKDEDYDTIIKKCINFMKAGIEISDELRQKLKLLATYKNTTYETILHELTEKELCKLKLDGALKYNKNKRNKKR